MEAGPAALPVPPQNARYVDAYTAWDRVHAANMTKQVGVKPSRPNPLGLPDLTKAKEELSWLPLVTLDDGKKYHTGGKVLASDEVPIIARKGEYVFTPEQIEDEAIDLVAITKELIRETMTLDIDNYAINGTGAGQPIGILNATGVSTVASGAAADVTYAGYVRLIFGAAGLPAQYRAGATIVLPAAATPVRYMAQLPLQAGDKFAGLVQSVADNRLGLAGDISAILERGHAILDSAGHEDDPLLQEPREDIKRAFAAAGLLDHHGDKIIGIDLDGIVVAHGRHLQAGGSLHIGGTGANANWWRIFA